MHFFYLDESGCTGEDLKSEQQPIFVIGGISVKAQGWRETTEQILQIFANFFGGQVPVNFELHASDLMNGKGIFSNFTREQRNGLVQDIIELIIRRKHAVHFIGIDKRRLAEMLPGGGHPIVDCNVPYLLGFNYMVSYIERYTKEKLGKTVRSMIILDKKDNYHDRIDEITNYRRYQVAKAMRLKWLVEFSYPVDSMRHPMIQVSDLIIFLVRKFLEVENGYKKDYQEEAKNFYASCYDKIIKRVNWVGLVNVAGEEEKGVHDILTAAQSTHRRNWTTYYTIE